MTVKIKHVIWTMLIAWVALCGWNIARADTVALVNLNAANRTFSVGGSQYLVAGDGTVTVQTSDASTFYLSGFQQVGATSGTSPLTTKGDLFGYSSTNARIPVGSNGQILTADSTQTLGLKWAAGGVSYPLLATNGALSTPSYSFASDNTAGFYFTPSGSWVNGVSEGSVFRFSGSGGNSTFQIISGNAFKIGAYTITADPVISVPTTGQTVDISPVSIVDVRVINPAGTLLALTVTLEDGALAGQQIRVTFTQAITGLTVTGNTSSSGLALPTAASIGSSFLFSWSNGSQQWVRIQ